MHTYEVGVLSPKGAIHNLMDSHLHLQHYGCRAPLCMLFVLPRYSRPRAGRSLMSMAQWAIMSICPAGMSVDSYARLSPGP